MNPAFTLTALEVHQRATPAAWDDLCMVMGGAPTPLDADDILSRWQGPSSPELRGAVRALVRNAGNVSGPEVLVALRTIESLDDDHRLGVHDLLWTGPTGGTLPPRRMDQALFDLLEGAKRRILLVTFAAGYVPTLTDLLEKAHARGVDIKLILETESDSAGQLSMNAASAFRGELLTKISVYLWPANQREKNAAGRPGKLHVKCAVVDDSAIVTSANLTDDAFNRNMELGVLSRFGAVPERIYRHFLALIQEKVLVRAFPTIS